MNNKALKKQISVNIPRVAVGGHFVRQEDNVHTPYQMFISKAESYGVQVQVVTRSMYAMDQIMDYELFDDVVVLEDPSPEAILDAARMSNGSIRMLICVFD